MKNFITLLVLFLVVSLGGCASTPVTHYKTTYYSENHVIINIFTEESKESTRVKSLAIMFTESSLDYRTSTSTVYDETLALKNHYESTIQELTSIVGVAFSTTDVFWNEPHPELFLSVMLLPQTFDLNSPNGDGYQLMIHLNFDITPSPEIKAYLKDALGIDSELTAQGLNLDAFMVNKNFKFHKYLNNQYFTSREKQ